MAELLVTAVILSQMCLVAALSVGSIAALRKRNPARARILARWGVVAGIAFFPVTFFAVSTIAVSIGDAAESRAYLLARGISEGMNTGVFVVAFGVAAVVTWIRARKLEAQRGSE